MGGGGEGGVQLNVQGSGSQKGVATVVLGVREPTRDLEGCEAELQGGCRRGRAGLAEDRPKSKRERSG